MDQPKYRIPQDLEILEDQMVLCHERELPMTFIHSERLGDDEFMFEQNVFIMSAVMFERLMEYLTRTGTWTTSGGS